MEIYDQLTERYSAVNYEAFLELMVRFPFSFFAAPSPPLPLPPPTTPHPKTLHNTCICSFVVLTTFCRVLVPPRTNTADDQRRCKFSGSSARSVPGCGRGQTVCDRVGFTLGRITSGCDGLLSTEYASARILSIGSHRRRRQRGWRDHCHRGRSSRTFGLRWVHVEFGCVSLDASSCYDPLFFVCGSVAPDRLLVFGDIWVSRVRSLGWAFGRLVPISFPPSLCGTLLNCSTFLIPPPPPCIIHACMLWISHPY